MNVYHSIDNHRSGLRRKGGFYPAIVPVIFLAACAPGNDAGGPPFSVDILPPLIQSAEAVDARRIRFIFDEAIRVLPEESEMEPPLPIESMTAVNDTLTVEFAEDQEIGADYVIRTEVVDQSGNSLSFLFSFTGWNPRIPEVLINEVNPRGSSSTPDCVELYLNSSGNLGGLEFIVGSEESAKGRFRFPAIDLESGDFIVVHTKPEGIPEEIDETAAVDASGGLLARDDARDFWMQDAPGLPGNNGAVVLYTRRGGEIIDAIIWSDRVDLPDEEKLGWTAESYIWIKEIAEKGGWACAGEIPLPSEAVDVSESTATRSLCRSSIPEDTDSMADWHTVPTRGQSFGYINTDEAYVP